MANRKRLVPAEVLEFLRKQAARGGKIAAKRMTKAERTARAKTAAAASAAVRSKNAAAKRKAAKRAKGA